MKPAICKGLLILIFAHFASLPLKTFAQGFADIDLSDRLGPVRDQRGTNICFAHAVADALSVKLGAEVGALSVMFRYLENRRRKRR